MRIRNSRPPFPIPSLPEPETESRPGYLPSQGRSCFDNPFSVEEANRNIGWSCYPLKKPLHQDVEEDQPHGDLQPMITREMKALNREDEEKGKNHCMQEKSSQALQGSDGELADGGNESDASTYQEDKNCSFVAIKLAIVLPASSSQLGKKLPLKKRKGSYLRETEKARKGEEDAMVEVKIKTEKLHGQEDADEKDSSKTMNINCVINYQCITPPSDSNSSEWHGKQDEMSLEEIFVEPREKPRRGRKRNLNYQSDDSYTSTVYKRRQKPKRGRPKKAINKSVNGNDGCGEKEKPRWGRPKMQKPKRGRPRKANSQSMIGNEDKQKPKRGRPKIVRDQSTSQAVDVKQ